MAISSTGPDDEQLEGFSAFWDETAPEAAILRITGDLDLSASGALRACLMEEVGLDGPPIVLDMTGVAFIDSTCLGVLIGAMRHANGGRGGMRVANAQARVQRAIEIAALDERLPMYASVDDALRAAARGD